MRKVTTRRPDSYRPTHPGEYRRKTVDFMLGKRADCAKPSSSRLAEAEAAFRAACEKLLK